MKQRLQPKFPRRALRRPLPARGQEKFAGEEDQLERALDPPAQHEEAPSQVVGDGLASQRLQDPELLAEVGLELGLLLGGDTPQPPEDPPELRGQTDFQLVHHPDELRQVGRQASGMIGIIGVHPDLRGHFPGCRAVLRPALLRGEEDSQ